MIVAEVRDIKEGRHTQVNGDTINEVINKIKEFHTMTDFEVGYYTDKGKLEEEIASGWYITGVV